MTRSERNELPPRHGREVGGSGLRTSEGQGTRPFRSFYTRALGNPPAVYGERIRWREDEAWRPMEPSRTKLGAALAKGLREPRLGPGTNVLYLGAATGTTASHVADLVGPSGVVYAVEKSPRAFLKLLAMARRWPNVAPVLRDARRPQDYLGLVPMVGAIYADISQADQVEIVTANAELFLEDGGWLLFAVKLSSMGRELTGPARVEQVLASLQPGFRVVEQVSLEPFHRKHLFLTARYGFRDGAPRSAPSPRTSR